MNSQNKKGKNKNFRKGRSGGNNLCGEGHSPSENKGPQLTLKVSVEDRERTGVTLPLKVWPYATTIKQLKEQVAREWRLPERLQCWLIDGMQPLDDAKLAEYINEASERNVILYVLSLRAAHCEITEEKRGWVCKRCTYVNTPLRPGCEQCSAERPADYVVPGRYIPTEKEKEQWKNLVQEENLTIEALNNEQLEREEAKKQNFNEYRVAYDMDINFNQEEFICTICMDRIPVGKGIILRECLHVFCWDCIAKHINYCEDCSVRCPFAADDYNCEAFITDHEIKSLVSQDTYEKYLKRSSQQAEGQERKSYHCLTPDCQGWCIYEDDVNIFKCPVCNKNNCLTCKAIHEGQNCQEYQDEIKLKSRHDENARKTHRHLQEMLEKQEAMKCPGCTIIVQKKAGCDWIECSVCKTEICWATLGPRWGPKGPGDTSGGCRCRLNGKPCHPNCGNCH